MRDWQAETDKLTNIGKLVHLAARMDQVDVENIRAQLVKQRRRAYEHEITLQAQRLGCAGRQGRLSGGPTLAEFNRQSETEAESIVSTYNYDLAIQIQAIRAETPTANRNTYASRLKEWDGARAKWKATQIAQWTEGGARDQAQKDFIQNNGIQNEGYVTVEPKVAAEPICEGLIKREAIPMREAVGIKMPVHIGCIHSFVTHPDRIPRAECANLWVGE